MTENEYIATDDDLPDNMWPEGERPACKAQAMSAETAAVTKLNLFYPEIRVPRSTQRRRAAAERSERSICFEERKVFVKLAKKIQMWSWLRALFEPEIIGQVRAENSDKVMDFLTRMYAKFYHYSPHKVKWVTHKQYDWLQHLAAQYIKVPR
jgi:hypothetical protein